MRKTVLASLLLSVSLQIGAQLTWLNPTPSGYINKKISFINDSSGYLMNTNGELYATRDTGNSWILAGRFPYAESFFIRDSTGIIPTTEGSIYLSTDNGGSWQKSTSSPAGMMVAWSDIVGRDTIFILKNGHIGAVKHLYKSVNRGTSWQLVNDNINLFNNNSIDFISSKIGYALKGDGIVKTQDGGITWQNIYTETTGRSIICLKFVDSLRGFAYRESSGMLRTTDGGLTWNTSNQPPDRINDIFFTSTLNAYAVGESGVVFRTTDGGITWNWKSPSSRIFAYDLFSQYFFNDTTGIITGHRGRILKTINGGDTWKWHAPTYIDVTGISFGSANTGYATTWNNIYKTLDGGKTWKELDLKVGGVFADNSRFDHCRFWSADTGFVIASQPARIYKTTDGGLTWTNFRPAPTTIYESASAISFISRDTGYMSLHQHSSSNGLFKTTDAGTSWQEVGSFQNFTKLHFLSDKVGYGTQFNKLFRTINGGVSWTELVVPDNLGLKSLWFITPSKGFILYDLGYLKMTLDSGATWTQVSHDQPQSFPDYTGIRFLNDKIGYITDDEGRFYKSTNGGISWKKAGNIFYYNCPIIYFRQDSTVLFGGMYGTIVSAEIGEYGIDSVSVQNSACAGVFKAKINAVLSSVDSIYFQYGKAGYTHQLLANPASVSDSIIQVSVTINNLEPDSLYKMRVKIYFKGQYYYSNESLFMPAKAIAPQITAAGNVLSSSHTLGNQWYLNGVLIAGATTQQYTATTSGEYTVRATQNGCSTDLSNPFNLIITALPDLNNPVTAVGIYPNPIVSDAVNITVKTNQPMRLQITDAGGNRLKVFSLNAGTNNLVIPGLARGFYIFTIINTRTNESEHRKILKL